MGVRGGGDSGPSGCSGGKEIPTHFALKCGRDLPCSHSNGDCLTCEDMLFSVKRHHVFARKLAWLFIGQAFIAYSVMEQMKENKLKVTFQLLSSSV